LMMYRVYWYSC